MTMTPSPRDIESRVRDTLARGDPAGPIPDTPAELYLDLAENVVRQATAWQTPEGMIGDPFNPPGVESITATARYTAAIGHLLRAERCLDLLPAANAAMDWCCGQMTSHYSAGKQWPAANFNLKDMLVLYAALAPLVPAARYQGWTEQLRAPVPERLYFGDHNWVFYGATAEVLRIRFGLSDRLDWVDAALASQMSAWTAQGMYRDPNDPATYDLTSRQALAMMLEYGYAGAHSQWLRETLRSGALATLLFTSPNGVAPCGGRSNQFHIMEGMTPYLAEWQARQEAAAGDVVLAGALRRLALAGAEAVSRWLLQRPYLATKNQMLDRHPFFGQDGYHPSQNAQSGYGLLAANLFAGAYQVADASIPVAPAAAAAGGYMLYLPDAFYRLWATAGSYHVQIDTRGQAGYDPTGLVRFHRRGVPIETALNLGMVANPAYLLPAPTALRSVALGVGWPADDGTQWRYLASAGRETHDVTVTPNEDGRQVRFAIAYRDRAGGLGTPLVEERYDLSENGLRCVCTVPGAARLRLQVPLVETDGVLRSQIAVTQNTAAVCYAGHTFQVQAGDSLAGWLEPWPAPNRNGIYRVAVFEVVGPQMSYEAVLS